MSEAAIEKYLVRRVREVGGEVRKVQWVGRRGAPDRLVLLPQCGSLRAEGVWVEVKAPGGVAKFPCDARERAQQREHDRLRAFGFRVTLVDSRDDVDALLVYR